MTITSQSLVNQKLAFTRFLLAQSQQLCVSTESRLQKSALLESALMHLVCAYRHHLHELAENARLKQVNRFANEEAILEALAQDGRFDTSVEALRELRTTEGSWLKTLLSTYDRLWLAPVDRAIKKSFSTQESLSLIAVQQLQDDPLMVLQQQIFEGLQAFQALVTEYRQTFFEC